MSIDSVCSCGAKFRAKAELAGRHVNCPRCGQPFAVPMAKVKPHVSTGKIRVACQCGKAFAANPDLAGKQLACPACGHALMVPLADPTKIRVGCGCGKTFTVKSSHAGKRCKCPNCGQLLTIPLTKTASGPGMNVDSSADPFGQHDDPFGQHDDPFGQHDDPLGQHDDPLGLSDSGALAGIPDPLSVETPLPAASGGLMHPRGTIPASGQKQSRQAKRQGLAKVAKGLNLVYLGTITNILAGLVAIFPIPYLPMLCLLVGIVGVVMITVGRIFCLFVPQETGAKGLIIGAVACDVVVFGTSSCSLVFLTLLRFSAGLVTSEGFSRMTALLGWIMVIGQVRSVATIGAGLLFMLFLRQLAIHLKERELADEAKTLLLLGCGLFAVGVVFAFSGMFARYIGGTVFTFVFGLAFAAFGLYLLFRYLGLVSSLANAIDPQYEY